MVDETSKRNALIDAVRAELKSENAPEAVNLDDCIAHWSVFTLFCCIFETIHKVVCFRVRSNGSQMHNTAAVLGGIVSQV